MRSEEKGLRLLDSLTKAARAVTSFTVVGDISADGAFDSVRQPLLVYLFSFLNVLTDASSQAVQSDPPFDYVVHTASPYHLSVEDPVKDFLDPAIKGTTGILKSIKAYAPTVKRVVITSSSAAILQLGNHPDVYDESVWADMTWEDGMDPQKTYKTSKVSARANFPPISLQLLRYYARFLLRKLPGPLWRRRGRILIWLSSITHTLSDHYRNNFQALMP